MVLHRNEAVFALFRDPWQAQDALLQLREVGFSDIQVGIMSLDQSHVDESVYINEGTATGAAVGASVGLVWGIGVVAEALPAIGPVIAGGTLAAVLTSAVAGAAAVGLIGALVGIGVARNQAEVLEQEINEGQTLVTVEAGDQDALAIAILLQCGANRTEHHLLDANVLSKEETDHDLVDNRPHQQVDEVAGSE